MNQGSASKKFRALAVPALLLSAGVSAWGQTYTAVNLSTLPGGVPNLQFTGLNNKGQVLGTGYSAGSSNPTVFLYTGGAITNLGSPSGAISAWGLNDSGQVVGQSQTATGTTIPYLYRGGTTIGLSNLPSSFGDYEASPGIYPAINQGGQIAGTSQFIIQSPDGGAGAYTRGFLYSGGMLTDIGTVPGFTGFFSTQASGINNSGQVVGTTYNGVSPYATRAFLYSDGFMTDLGTLGGTAVGNAINDLGQAVGWSSDGVSISAAVLFSDGTVTNLGTPPGILPNAVSGVANGINNLSRVVGYFYGAIRPVNQTAFLYHEGQMVDLNTLVTGLDDGVYLVNALAINDSGQILAVGVDTHAGATSYYLLSPDYLPLTVLNPFALYAGGAPPTLDVSAAPIWPKAVSLAADGQSAVVLVYRYPSPQPVTFELAATGKGLIPNLPVGSLGPYDANYLASPNPAGGQVQSYQVTAPTSGPDADGNYLFFALLWAPNAMPEPNVKPVVFLTVTATQKGTFPVAKATVDLKAPPVLLVHDIWSSAAGAGFSASTHGFNAWLQPKYPHTLIRPVEYKATNSLSFADPQTQDTFVTSMTDLLVNAAVLGMAARSVDVVAHGMGGLVTRYFLSQPALPSRGFLPNPVHTFITIGTPHLGSNLAQAVVSNQNLSLTSQSPLVQAYCSLQGACTLGHVMGLLNKPVGTGAQSLEPGSTELNSLSPSNVFSAIVGSAPAVSATGSFLNLLINAFLPGQSVNSILNNNANDTIVDGYSQDPHGAGVTIPGLVHTAICNASSRCPDQGEAASPAVWAQAYYWLTGGTAAVPTPVTSSFAPRPMTSAPTAPLPVLDLSAYTPVDASNVAFLPADGSSLTVNNASAITATSSTKTIAEVLLLQTVTDSTDTALLYATQEPFTIPFTPTRLGSTTFGAIAVFSDYTYATTTLNYTFAPDGTPYALTLGNAPVASMAVASSRVIEADAQFTSGPANVTQAATYTARSGSTSVFSVSAGGAITANGNGVDLLDVSYGGVTATAQIPVGTCTYVLSPANQIVADTGGTATIQVTTQPGCAWTADDGGAAWLAFAQASGSGNGAITLTASANSSGGAQGAMVTVGGVQALVTQPATACTYSLSPAQISAPAIGASGAVTATTSCPVIASSDQSWLTASPLGSVVQYTVAANNGTAQRSATLTIGTMGIKVTQAGFVPALWQIVSGNVGNFYQGQFSAAYTVTVSNLAAGVPSTGLVTVTETLPSGMTLVSMSGTGWSCSSNVCTRSDVVNPGAGYPAITVNVNISSDAPSSVTNQVSVSGGGALPASASDVTAISPFSTCDLKQTGNTNVADVQLVTNEALGVTRAVNDLTGDGAVNVVDVQIEMSAALGLGCTAK